MRTLKLGILVGSLVLASAAQASAILMASPSSAYFPQTEVRSRSISQHIWIRNVGSETAKMLTLMDTCMSDFQVYDTCGFDLAPGMSCSVNITFSPWRAGYHSCSITVRSSSGGSAYINASGTGVERREN